MSQMHNATPELSVIGAVFLEPVLIQKISSHVSPDDFGDPRLRAVYAASIDLAERGLAIDYVSLRTQLQNPAILDAVWTSARSGAQVENLQSHIHLMKMASSRRKLSSLIEQSGSGGSDVTESILALRNGLDEIEKGAFVDEPTTYSSLKEAYLLQLKERAASKSDVIGLPTGLAGLDHRLGGWEPGKLIVLAARPGMGKTALALKWVDAAAEVGENVAVFSMEMPSSELFHRSISRKGRINGTRLKRGQMTELELAAFKTAINDSSHENVYVDDTGGLSWPELKSRIVRLYHTKGIKMVVIDYLQLMSLSGVYGSNTNEKIGEITRQMKGLAKELGIPIILLSQLNRELERRPDKRPMNSDLRSSGSIEQDADIIIFIYRDIMYNEATRNPNLAEIIIGKAREAETCTVNAEFQGEFSLFKDYKMAS